MYAVFKNGGKQYRVKEGQTIRLEKISDDIGNVVKFDQVLMYSKNDQIFFGNPLLKNSFIKATIISHGKNKKIRIIKFRRRKHHRKHQGHRQNFTEIKITDIKYTI
ncbi:50S ribosomal protein L21 [Candidatus Tachikawaea gelatinosa]|uniref:Large ribosomal subunit protein bL21 n=1 Tax=Candidatus Tachikawaea gelatinosa TaxID=1410383 RepID=A0A090AM01_9ENTR|nr:50S ribosomal protein L21 [Candidatus Tachikawaea gelatinosa]BAP58684.1 50S ribosomal protein L21 [Candidatus Tachikawaea gelatinosa]